MTARNLVVVIVAIIVFLVCHSASTEWRYGAIVGRAMTTIEDKALERIGRRELFYAAMDGMMKQLDEHSAFVNDQRFPKLEEHLNQQFGGVGILMEKNTKTGDIFVLSPIRNSPAQQKGIQAGDLILEVDGKKVAGMATEAITSMVKGKMGTAVKIVTKRGSEEPKEIELTREGIAVDSVLGDSLDEKGAWSFVLREMPNIGYIRLTEFGERSTSEMREALGKINGKVDGLVLDLRSNSGGLLDSAVDICDMFLEDSDTDPIVTIKGRDGSETPKIYSPKSGLEFPKGTPIAVIINGESASAAEILAACLQDHGRAIVVGQKSFGKGTVQQIIQIDRGQCAIKLTTASYWRPSGKNIHRTRDAADDAWGVSPDDGFQVALDESAERKMLVWRRMRDYPLTTITPEYLETLAAPMETPMNSPQPTDSIMDPTPSSETPKGESDKVETKKPAEISIQEADPQLQRAIDAVMGLRKDPVASTF